MIKINLKDEEVDYLTTFVKKGNKSARAITRARILLLSNNGKKDDEIKKILSPGRSTIWRVKNNYLSNGIEYALTERDRLGQPPKYDGKNEAEIIAFACTKPPEGRKRWSLRLLVDELRKKKGFKTVNRETIRLTLKKTIPNLG